MYQIGYVMRVLIAVDQILNALLNGYPDETLSSRIYRNAELVDKPKWYWKFALVVVDTAFFLQTDHCRKSYEIEKSLKHHDPNFVFRD